MKKFIIPFLCAVLIFSLFRYFVRLLETNVTDHQSKRPVAAWKKSLNSVGFKGNVTGRGKYNFTERNLFLIELGNVEMINPGSIPKDCEFFILPANHKLNFVAYSQNVDRWDKYGLNIGDIMEKKVNNDTIVVSSPDNTPKYLFELFDGIANKWIPRELP